jgi:N-acyl-D-aspartate/D-glutamate deacylase
MDYDLKIVGADIVDGTGRERFRGDIGIRDGRIAALGAAPGSARETIDAGGLVAAPGFVDIHTHYDAQVLWDRMLTISPWHGVTTVVMGNCGFGVAPTRPQDRNRILRTLEKVEGMSVEALEAGVGHDWPFQTFPEYLDALERLGSAVNLGVLVGHTPVRFWVMGEEATERHATAEEVAAMKAIVREALDAGAVGFATSKAPTHVGYDGRPVPSRAAEVAEIKALAGALKEAGRGVMQATIGKELFLKEFAEIARETGRPITWTALLAGVELGGRGSGGAAEQLARSEALAAEGLAIAPQVSPRALSFEYQYKAPFLFEPMSLFKPLAAADAAGKARIYADPEFRKAFAERMLNTAPETVRTSFAKTVISQYAPEPALEERPLFEVARERGAAPTDLALDLALRTDLEARFRAPVANHREDEVEPLLKSKCTVLGLSDAGAHASQLCDACLPTYLLGRWVREKSALSLEEAVRMLTSRPAEVFGLADRGRLAVGAPADVVVFDPATVGAGKLRRVNDFPAGADRLVSDASGIEAVIVNGATIRRRGVDAVDPTGRLPGKLLRGGRAAA